MPRLTSEQLREAKLRKQEEERLQQEQEEQEAEEEEARLAEEAERIAAIRERYYTLKTVADSHYIELDKLAKKAPKERLTDLNLRMVNDLIRDTKTLLEQDAYLKSVTVFEAAGDNPEYRDALMIVGQLRAALSRFTVPRLPDAEEDDPFKFLRGR